MSLRNRELLTLLAVAVLTGLGFASVYIARQAEISAGSLAYAVFFLAVYAVAHLAARFATPNADPYLVPIAGLLTAAGVTEIYRLNPQDALRQSMWIVVAVALLSITLWAFRKDYRALERYKYLLGLGSITLLMLPALPVIGTTINGARLWVRVGPLQFQPGEIAKLMLIVFLAAYLREKREVLAKGRLKDFGPLLLIWGVAMLTLYFGIFLAMLYAATGRALFVALGLLLLATGGYGAHRYVSHVRERITIWLHPWTSQPVPCAFNGQLALRQDCASYQLVKSLYSIGHGGIGGTGLGKGTFTNASGGELIPFLKTDFIYSALAQELGLVGVAGVVLVYMLFTLRGFRVAHVAQDGFSKLLATGLTFGFALQTFIILGGVLRIIPLTGITLPFISYGGSSVVANFVLVAGLLLVSHRANSRS